MKFALAVSCIAVLSFACGMALESARAGTSAPPAGVTGIGGIFFKSSDPQKLGAWYRDHLGIEPAAEAGSGAPPYHVFEWREKGESQKLGATAWSVFPQATKYFGAGPQSFMIDYRVDNLGGVLAQLRAAGARVDSKIDDEPNGRFAWATDPEGNRFELWQPKP
ncbi:MAG TPA: VOC family protein [Candidatus Acidoferrales bacterium]|jgi:predicted enzyme related to lactoylglutathione lyase|nr:VOC family protein [Candidatus Acidoferrales bacterium]